MINSPEAIHSRKQAYSVALQIYPDEVDDQVRAGLINLILAFGKGDPKAFDYFQHAAYDASPNVVFIGSMGLLSYPQGVEEGLQRLRYAFDSGSTMLQRMIIGEIGKLGQKAEGVIDLVTRNLGSTSWFMRRTTKKAVKNLMKADVNVVKHLVDQLEIGSNEDKVAACAGLGELDKEAKGSVGALGEALKDPSVSVREKAAWALLQMEKNAAPAEAQLQAALKDESPAVSKYALKTLNKFSKLSKDQKEQIKELEEHEKEIKQIQRVWGLKDKEEPKESEEETSAEPEYKNKFFMSHSTKDFAWVQKVSKVIESWPGCKAWMCERDIYQGQNWMEAIYDGIEECNWYILFWSQNAQSSKWTMEEIEEAKLRNVESDDTNPKVSIVNLGMSEMPRLLALHQGSKVTKDEDIAEFCNRLKTQVEF
ncbi:MAG TPA: TIR domain-containing protein [Candidatus Lokiarchaeia archaeon]|nr:TIR domain-containing protein [Candidatus Lokiarchaeia archaeon]